MGRTITSEDCSMSIHESDALSFLRSMDSQSVALIYVDPPFNTGTFRGSYNDAKMDILSYVEWLNDHMIEARRVLIDRGSIYVHLDWRTVHYVKVMMDRVFGYECFLNNIVWLYGLGGSSPRYWPRKHDDILWYCKDPDLYWFDCPRVPAKSNMMAGQDKKCPDYWDIPSINNMAHERTGYSDQKPIVLLERIVVSSSKIGDTVLDFFAGSGTAGEAAKRNNRKYILVDRNPIAVKIMRERLGVW